MNESSVQPQLQQPKEGKFKTSLKLTRAAWRVIKLDKEILGMSALGIVAGGVLGVVYLVVLFAFREVFLTDTNDNFGVTPWFYGLTALVAFVSYIIANYFAGAISHAAFRRFDGQDPTFDESISAANRRLPALINFSGLQATVGLILNIIEDRVPLAGKIAVWVTGAAWGVATMFAIPLIMDTGERNPLKVVKVSARTFLSIWKESVFVGLSLGIIGILAGGLLLVVVIVLFGFAAATSSIEIGIIAAGAFAIGVASMIILTQALQSVVMTAAYYYAVRKQLPAGFDEELVRSMFRPKKKWLR